METLLGRVRAIGTYRIQCYPVESFELHIKDNAIQEAILDANPITINIRGSKKVDAYWS